MLSVSDSGIICAAVSSGASMVSAEPAVPAGANAATSAGVLPRPVKLMPVRLRRRRLYGEPIAYSLLRSEQGLYTVRLRFRGKTVSARTLTSSRSRALSFFRRLVEGKVLPDTFFDIVEDFLAES